MARGASDDAYLAERKEILADHGLAVYAISNHLTGQAVCDHPIDERHQGILPSRIWGDGDAEGVRRRAAEEISFSALRRDWRLPPSAAMEPAGPSTAGRR